MNAKLFFFTMQIKFIFVTDLIYGNIKFTFNEKNIYKSFILFSLHVTELASFFL